MFRDIVFSLSLNLTTKTNQNELSKFYQRAKNYF